MLDFIDFFKQKIIFKKHFFTFFLLPVFFFFSSLSGFAYSENIQSFPLKDTNVYLSYFVESADMDIEVKGEFLDNNLIVFNSDDMHPGKRGTLYFTFGNSTPFNFPVVKDVYDYYLVASVYGPAVNISDFSFFPFDAEVSFIDHDNQPVWVPYDDCNFYHLDSVNTKGFSVSMKLNINDFSNISELKFYSEDAGTCPKILYFELSIIAIPVNSSSGDTSSAILNAIINQTNAIMNAGSGFGGTTSGIQSGNDELSGFINDYTEVEQSMYDKFTENQSAVSGNFTGWSWGSLSTAVDWTSDYLNRIYDNSGDFRTMFMYPILAGIALIFIGRRGLTAYVRSRREK